MAIKAEIAPQQSLYERVMGFLDGYLDSSERVDIIQFCESPDYLGQRLYPRQRLILKLFYHVPLGVTPCYTCADRAAPDPLCRWCGGSGEIDELQDAKRLLACDNKYARLYMPGLCEHHIPLPDGSFRGCQKEWCREPFNKDDYRTLSDEEIAERLLYHDAYICGLMAGRRGSKSFLLSMAEAYTPYVVLTDPHPFRTYRLSAASVISAGNAANKEEQAQVIFEVTKNLMENSPFFQRQQMRPLDVVVEFPTKNFQLCCYHTNAASIRGNTNMDIYLDEYLVMRKSVAEAIWKALVYSTATFKRTRSRHVFFASSPGVRDGKGYEIADGVVRRVRDDAMFVQLATWEMNPNLERGDFDADYQTDFAAAEVEFGAQWADVVNTYIPERAIEACVPRDEAGRGVLPVRGTPRKGTLYSLHCDLSKKHDSLGLVVAHDDPDTHDVVTDWVEEFAPSEGDQRIIDRLGEVDMEKVLDYILDLRKRGFKFQSVTFDQFNSTWIIQRLRKEMGDPEGEIVYEVSATQRTNNEMAANLRNLIVQGRIRLPDFEPLLKQLRELQRIERENGSWKVEAPATGKDDLTDPLQVVAWEVVQRSLRRVAGIHVVEADRTPLTSRPAADPSVPQHHPECTETYCHFLCEWHRALLAGRLPK